MNEDIEKIINESVNTAVKRTIAGLKANRILKDDQKTGIEKIESLLRYYPVAAGLDDEQAQKIASKISNVLDEIKSDLYYDIIPLTYFDNELRERIAERFGTSVTTISRNKKRLLIELEKRIIPNDFIFDILSV